MTSARTAVLVALLVACLGFAVRGPALPTVGTAAGTGLREITGAQRSAGLTFGASATHADRQAVIATIAAARPDAQRLIAIVDGLVTIRVGSPGGSALGVTRGGGSLKGYDIVVDLPTVNQQSGARGISRLVLHELGHVVDHALLQPDLQARRSTAASRPASGARTA